MSLSADIDAFLKSGGKVQQIPTGVGNAKAMRNPRIDPEDIKAKHEQSRGMSHTHLRLDTKPRRYGKK